MPILFEPDQRAADVLVSTIGGDVEVVDSAPQLGRVLNARPDELLVVIGASVDAGEALSFARGQAVTRPALGVVLLRRRVDVALLTEALRAGVRDVVQPDQLTAVSEACRRSLEQSRRAAGAAGARPAASGHVITVFAAKGGAGKTTISTNLAAAFADSGRRTCIVDLDLAFGDVGIVLQVPPGRTIAEAVTMSGELDERTVGALLTPCRHNLAALLAPVTPGEAERVSADLVGALLETLRRMADVIVIDTPPAFTEHVLAALDASDSIVLVATPDVAALKNLRLAIDTLDQLGYPKEGRRLVLNRADEKVGLSVDDVEQVLEARLDCRIPSSRDVATAFNRGVPLVVDAPKHAVSKSLRSFALDIVGGGAAAHETTGDAFDPAKLADVATGVPPAGIEDVRAGPGVEEDARAERRRAKHRRRLLPIGVKR